MSSIPEKISYIYGKPSTIIIDGVDCEIFPSFPVKHDDQKAINKAILWAGKTHIIDTFDNSFSDVKIVCLEHRGEGGRAYKTLINNKYYIDLREDVLLDCIIEAGINAGGKLIGDFCWAKITNQTKLIRINSKIHKSILDEERRSKLPIIKKKDLEIGGVYVNKKGVRTLFLGNYNTTFYKDEIDYYKLRKNESYFSYNKKVMNISLSYTYHNNEAFDPTVGNLYNIINVDHNIDFVEKIDHISITNNITNWLRSSSLKFIKDRVSAFANKSLDEYSLHSHVSHTSYFLNIYNENENKPEDFDIKKYIAFM